MYHPYRLCKKFEIGNVLIFYFSRKNE